MTSKTDNLQSAINGTGWLSVVLVEPLKNGASILCRHVPGKETQVLQLFSSLLSWEEAAKSSFEGLLLNVSRRYLLKEGRMVFGWNITLQTKKAADFQSALISIVTTFPKSTQIPIHMAKKVVHVPQQETSSSSIRLVNKRQDGDTGEIIEEFEMPLPHQTKPMNVPSTPTWSETHGRYVGGGRGARRHSGD